MQWWHEPPRRVVPAQECLESGNAAARYIHDRLVM